MLLSIALIILSGLVIGSLMKRMHLPPIIGYLLAGFLLGPYCLNWLDTSLLQISAEIRRIALVMILMKAGLSLGIADLRRIGRPAILLCFVPATFEILAYLMFAPRLLALSTLEAGLLGAVMAAVSPAVVVPRMTRMMDEGWGTKKGIPQMIVAGASADDVYVIVIFSALLSLASGGTVSAWDFLQIPIAILSGVLVGLITGLLVAFLLKTIKVDKIQEFIILISIAFLLLALEEMLKPLFSMSGLLAIMSMCITLRFRDMARAAAQAKLCGKAWVGAEIFLFALVGAIVDVRYIKQAGIAMAVMLLIGLCFRLAGTWLSVTGKGLTRKEKIFCAFSETPKATVQAAIGGVPLAAGLACGNTILAFAVLAILVTAPVGATLIDATYQRWLKKDKDAISQ